VGADAGVPVGAEGKEGRGEEEKDSSEKTGRRKVGE